MSRTQPSCHIISAAVVEQVDKTWRAFTNDLGRELCGFGGSKESALEKLADELQKILPSDLAEAVSVTAQVYSATAGHQLVLIVPHEHFTPFYVWRRDGI